MEDLLSHLCAGKEMWPSGRRRWFATSVYHLVSWVRIPSFPRCLKHPVFPPGGITQLVECLLCTQKVIGSTPVTSTSKIFQDRTLSKKCSFGLEGFPCPYGSVEERTHGKGEAPSSILGKGSLGFFCLFSPVSLLSSFLYSLGA